MKYYIQEVATERNKKIAMGKAREDVNIILNFIGFKPINIPVRKHTGTQKFFRQFQSLADWNKSVSSLKRGDSLLIQYPPLENSLFLNNCLNRLTKKGVKIDLLIHDMRTLGGASYIKKKIFQWEEFSILKLSKNIIVHNEKMMECFEGLGVKKTKMISLGIFDYIIDEFEISRLNEKEYSKNAPIIIAGNLSPYKASYIGSLPNNCEFNLYGIGYKDTNKPNIHYKGSFLPDELPYELIGGFGLVWDGDSAETCSGGLGEYLKINNPHKTSLYLASNIPIIIWSQAALADFVIKNKCGIVVDSIYDISHKINSMTNEEYSILKENAAKIGNKIRNGFFLKSAIDKI